jgi:hypothetical protein
LRGQPIGSGFVGLLSPAEKCRFGAFFTHLWLPRRTDLFKKKKKKIHTNASGMLGQTTKALANLWEFNPSLALNNNQKRS